MTALVPIIMFGWVPVVLALFAWLAPRQAVIAAYLVAWLFLPMAGYSLVGFPDYTKVTATNVGVLLGVLIFDNRQIYTFRFQWFDLLMLIYCLVPFISSLTNGLGYYDGASNALTYTIMWGLPYLFGRLYFTSLLALRELAMGILIGGLLYVPLCLYEIRMSPQLHTMFYGFHQHEFVQAKRWGGYRPVVFMKHGLSVAFWMTSSTLVAVWLWQSGAVKQLWKIPMGYLALLLLVTSVLCKSLSSLVLLALGLLVLFIVRRWLSPIPLLCLILSIPVYITLRATDTWSGEALVSFVGQYISQDRAQSLQTRFDNENMLVDKAMLRPWFGWGGWGRSRVMNDEGKDITISDGLWIIVLGRNGVVGLTSLILILILPAVLFTKQFPVKLWADPHVSSVAVIVVLGILYTINALPNADINPIYFVLFGAVLSLSKMSFYPDPLNKDRFLVAFSGSRY